MDQVPNEPQQPPATEHSPAPQPSTRRIVGRGLAKAGIGVGLAAGVAVGASLIANAATSPSSPSSNNLADSSGSSSSSSSSSSSTSTTTPQSGPNRKQFGGPFVPFGPGLGGPGGPVIHGQFTIQGPNGYETMDERTGTVSDITNTSGSNWSLTVKSSDGTSATFVVDSGTSVNGGETGIASVKQGDTVTVEALDSSGTATAKYVVDRTVLQNNGGGWMSKGPPAPGPAS